MLSGGSTWVKFVCKKAFKFGIIAIWGVLALYILAHNYRPPKKPAGPQMFSVDAVARYPDRPSYRRTYLALIAGNVYIYSAIARNSTSSYVDKIALSGWEHNMFRKVQYKCCLLYGKDDIDLKLAVDKIDWSYVGRSHLEAKQFVCPNPRVKSGGIPLGVSLTMESTCPHDISLYVKVQVPRKQPDNKIAVCSKIAFGDISASSIIEWFEMQRLLGVHTVLSYTNDLNQDAMSVLNYYRDMGFSEHRPFYLPDKDRFVRSVGVKNFQSWNDEQISVFDCHGRLAGYDYIALFDMDEYVVPQSASNLTNLMLALRATAPNACGFTFKTELYATTWGRTNEGTSSNLTIARYLNRTNPIKDRVKSIIINSRIAPGRLSTHAYWPVKTADKPYTKNLVNPQLATLKHYRTCRKEWMRQSGKKCYKEVIRVRDTSMLKWAAKIEDRVNHVKWELGIE